MKKIYFAGPLFCCGEKNFNLSLASIFEEYGYQVFLPQRDGYEAAQLKDKSSDEISKMIFQKDTTEILNADIFFMVLDGRVPDDGACVELGIAYANGKQCYGLKTDNRALELGLDLNPLISGCFHQIYYCVNNEDVLEELRNIVRKWR